MGKLTSPPGDPREPVEILKKAGILVLLTAPFRIIENSHAPHHIPPSGKFSGSSP